MSTGTGMEDFGEDLSSTTWGLGSLALIATLVVIYALAQAQERKGLPPGPRPWPVVGNLFVMLTPMPHRALEKLAAKYGGIMYLRLGSRPCIIISTAAAAEEMFKQSNDVNLSNRPKGLFAQVCSDNYRTIVHSRYGPHWRQLRKFSGNKLLSPTTFASYRGVREEELRSMMTILVKESARAEPINVKLWLFELSANTLTMMLVNKRYFGSGGESQEEKAEFQQVFASITRCSMSPVISDFLPSLSILTKFQGQDRLFKKIRDDAVRVVGKMTELEKHRGRAKERSLRNNDEPYVPDLVDFIIEEPLDNGTPLPDNLITLVLMELLVAGTDTQATTVEWAMAELMANSEMMKQARDELDAVVGCGRVIQESDMPSLPYLQAIVKETFRSHPPLLARESSQPTEAWGYKIPAGSQILVNLHAIHSDPAIYQNPEVFNPQRYLDRPEVKHLSGLDFYELIPFGIGRRMCPGYSLGNEMVHLMIGNLIHSFDWSFPEGQSVETCRRDNVDEIFGLTVCRKKPLLLLAKPRQRSLA